MDALEAGIRQEPIELPDGLNPLPTEVHPGMHGRRVGLAVALCRTLGDQSKSRLMTTMSAL